MLNLKEDSKDLKRWKSEIRFVNVRIGQSLWNGNILGSEI